MRIIRNMNDMNYRSKADALFTSERRKFTKVTMVVLFFLVFTFSFGMDVKEENRLYQMFATVFTELDIVSRTTDMEIVYNNGDIVKLNAEQLARIKSMPNMDFDIIPYYKRIIISKLGLKKYAEVFYYENEETRGSIVLFDVTNSGIFSDEKKEREHAIGDRYFIVQPKSRIMGGATCIYKMSKGYADILNGILII